MKRARIRLVFVFAILAGFAPFPAHANGLPAFCKALVKHVPDADVTYQPGIDVHGKPVVPADLDGSQTLTLPDKIEIPLSVDMMQTAGLKTTEYPFNLMQRNDIKLGTLTLEGDRVLFNGQPLNDAQQDKLAILCMH